MITGAESDDAQADRAEHRLATGRQCSRFYPLAPIGIGEGHCEGPVSYLCRLAFSHGVSVDDLVNIGLSAHSDVDFRIWRHFSVWSRKSAINIFTERRTRALLDALVSATGVEVVGNLSLASLDGVVDLAGMSSTLPRHCVLCERDVSLDRLSRPLLWDLAVVNCCPIHEARLIPARCGRGADGQGSMWRRVHLPGVCRSCGAIAYTCNPEIQSAGSTTEMWVARQSARLIAAVSSGERFSAEVLRESIVAMATAIGEGRPFRAAARCGVNKGRLHDWIHGVRPIKFAPLLALVATSGADLVDALRGELRFAASVEFSYLPRRHRPPACASHQLAATMQRALADPVRPSLAAVATLADLDRATLVRLYPNESSEIVSTSRDTRAQATRRRAAHAAERMAEVADVLRNAGRQVTVQTVWAESGILVTPGSRYESFFRREQMKREPGLEPASEGQNAGQSTE